MLERISVAITKPGPLRNSKFAGQDGVCDPWSGCAPAGASFRASHSIDDADEIRTWGFRSGWQPMDGLSISCATRCRNQRNLPVSRKHDVDDPPFHGSGKVS
jgi:hypothetical protein